MRIQRLVQVTLLAALALTMSGCGRSYHIKGRVILLPELQSAAGFIVEFTHKDFPQGGRPIVGAKVRMLHQLDKAGKPIEDSGWKRETVTDDNGFFDVSSYAAPSQESKVGLEVSKEGYRTVYTTYIDYYDVEPQVFLVVLAPDGSANKSLSHP